MKQIKRKSKMTKQDAIIKSNIFDMCSLAAKKFGEDWKLQLPLLGSIKSFIKKGNFGRDARRRLVNEACGSHAELAFTRFVFEVLKMRTFDLLIPGTKVNTDNYQFVAVFEVNGRQVEIGIPTESYVRVISILSECGFYLDHCRKQTSEELLNEYLADKSGQKVSDLMVRDLIKLDDERTNCVLITSSYNEINRDVLINNFTKSVSLGIIAIMINRFMTGKDSVWINKGEFLDKFVPTKTK
jgi:hypothetical protein